MIREASSYEPPTVITGSDRVHSLHAGSALPQEDRLATVESVEGEISRLTWAVLDGRASVEERNRLAELVNAQHERRNAQ